jgi:SOS-response transcriptional repressor LexA
MNRLTLKQQRFFDTVYSFTKEHGFPPTITDLCEIFSVSIGTVQQYFFALEKKGFIKRENNKGRGLKFLIEQSEEENEYLKIPIIKSKLINTENVFGSENTEGFFKFPKKIFDKEKKIYAVHFPDSFVIFVPGQDKKKKDLIITYKNKRLSLKKADECGKDIHIGWVIYILQKKIN